MIHDYYLSNARNHTDTELAKEKSKILNNVKIGKETNPFYPKPDDVEKLSKNSTLIKIPFTLKKPYTSKDEGEFHILDESICENPIVRDNLTGLPMVKPSTWKGHLRYAAGMIEDTGFKNKETIIRRLFGSNPGEDNACKGRLYFFPTFFKDHKTKKDVITPLKRDTRTPSKGPIPLEVMDTKSEGEFHLLYFPYPKGKDYDEKQVEKDLNLLVKSLELMFYTYGFSAKKTSGFGVIERLKESDVDIHPEEKRSFFSNLWDEVGSL